MLVAGDDTTVVDPTTGNRLAVLRAGTARILDARFGADGRTVVTGDDDGVVRLWSAGASGCDACDWDTLKRSAAERLGSERHPEE